MAAVKVNVDNFVRAETDLMFASIHNWARSRQSAASQPWPGAAG